jgi:MFS family permease
MRAPRLPPVTTIVVAELMAVSLWFSANAAAEPLRADWGLTLADIGALTNAVQLGFVVGTLLFALTGLADRHAASRLFAVCALVGAAANAGFALFAQGMTAALPLRFAVGVALAGVYPVGMKLVVSWAPERAPQTLAWLVGMLTLGTALPHGLRGLGAAWPWQAPVLAASTLAVVAAVLVARLGDGPHLPRATGAARAGPREVLANLRVPAFRASALGYFGHMWELYAFWALVPTLVAGAGIAAAGSAAQSHAAFAVIAAGALGCIGGGWWSRRIGGARVAAAALAGSALCCAAYPLAAGASPALMLALLLAWGVCVVADSPQFSALSAAACHPQTLGSALALQNALGFALTMVSIQLATAWVDAWGASIAWLLLAGPLLGRWGLRPRWAPARR